MNGINLFLDSNHITKGNAFKAVQQITELKLSVGSLNYYINEALDIDEEREQGFTLPKIEDAETAKRILAFMAQTAIPKRIEKFDLKTYNVFRARANLPSVSFECVDSDEEMNYDTNAESPGSSETVVNPSPAISAKTNPATVLEETNEIADTAGLSEPDSLPIASPAMTEGESSSTLASTVPAVVNSSIETSPIEFSIGPVTPVEKIVAEVTEVKKSGRGRKSDPNSAVNVAKRLYSEASDKSRDAILKLFQEKLGLESGTAMTYYYIARKG